jgi:hypothetical protein
VWVEVAQFEGKLEARERWAGQVEERGRVDGVQCWRGLVRMGCVCAVTVSLRGRITAAEAAAAARVPRRGVANHRARKLVQTMRARCDHVMA